jgi:phosphoadenosine phosphosulfate reductase
VVLGAPEVRERAAALRDAHPEAILAWAVEAFRGRVALTLSFGGPGVVLAHLLTGVDRTVPVIFLDTGMLFEETYAFRREFAERYGLNVQDVRPAFDPGPLYATDPDRCCAIRKVEPMARAIAGFDAWVSGVRRDQSESRRDVEVAEYHEIDGRPLVKVHPLAYWDRSAVWRYLLDHEIPYHPLLDQGYTSLGCWPCTRPTHAGESERAGRWSGTGKTECGLHTFTARGGSA